MDFKALVLFDIDGVVRDVENSYRLALQETVNHFSKWRPSNQVIDSLKSEGNWNNDWDASLELIRRRKALNKLKIKLPSRDNLIREFSKFYFGSNPDNQDHTKWNGFIKNEKLLVNKEFFDKLTEQEVGWGFVSGAEPPSAKFVLEHRIGLIAPPLIAMGDAPDKPNPEGLIRLGEQLLSKPLGKGTPPIAYVGDTVADVLTIGRARKKCPNQRFTSFAVAPPHLHKKANIKERTVYEYQLKKAGADEILLSTHDIIKHISNW